MVSNEKIIFLQENVNWSSAYLKLLNYTDSLLHPTVKHMYIKN